MKIEYMRNMHFGYMRLELENPLTKTEEAMLTHNVIEGLLPVCWQQENDRYLLRYDITGKQALDSVLEQTMADETLLRHLLIGIIVTIKELEKYLLPQEGLLLKPETIFCDNKTKTMHFCFSSEGNVPLQEQLVKLMEYILAKTDHKNISAVQMAYGVYEEVQNPLFCLEDLHSYLKEKYTEAESEICLESVPVANGADYEWEQIMEEEKRGLKRQKIEWIEKAGIWFRRKIDRLFKGHKQELTVIYDKAPVAPEGATTVLGNTMNRSVGILQYEGINSLPDIRVTHMPFIIGSAADCDGIINHPNISRKHAKITCRDEVYFIEDLNSTNGTRVNGGVLNYKTKVSIRSGTDICFANEPYRFL